MAPVDDALDRLARLRVMLVGVLNDARPSPDWSWEILHAWDAMCEEREQLREERDDWEKIAESRALYAHKQAARMGAHASAPQPTPVSGVPLAATGKASEGAEDGTGIDTRYRGRAEAAEAEVATLTHALETVRREVDLPDHISEFGGGA